MKPTARSGKLFAFVLCVLTAPYSLAEISLPYVNGPAILTVSGAGYWNREQIGYGDSPYISVVDSNGEMLRDGVYQYELKSVAPTPETGAGDGEIALVAPPVAVTSNSLERGTFTIEGG